MDVNDQESPELFYLQDTRQHVGNSMLWWAKDGQGYTCDIRKAHVYTKGDAMKCHRQRSSDRPWPKTYIDARVSHHIDAQHCEWDVVKPNLPKRTAARPSSRSR